MSPERGLCCLRPGSVGSVLGHPGGTVPPIRRGRGPLVFGGRRLDWRLLVEEPVAAGDRGQHSQLPAMALAHAQAPPRQWLRQSRNLQIRRPARGGSPWVGRWRVRRQDHVPTAGPARRGAVPTPASSSRTVRLGLIRAWQCRTRLRATRAMPRAGRALAQTDALSPERGLWQSG